MSDAEEKIWRAALQLRGRTWVRHALNSRHGQPGDPVFDVVFEPPYPTREFVQRWCSERGNEGFALSGHAKVLIAAALLLIAFSTLAVRSFTAVHHNPETTTW
jgi:hypothetical protein